MRREAGSGGGQESREGPGTSFSWWLQESPYPLSSSPPGKEPPKPLPRPVAPPSPAPRAVPRGPPHLASVAQGARAGLPEGPAGPCRLQAALPRGRGPGLTGRQRRALRPMALGPAAPAHSVLGTFSRRCSRRRRRRRRQAGGCALASTRSADTHVEGGREGRAGIHPGRLPRSRGHAATAAPTGGSRSRLRPGPARARRAVPRRCRSALTLAQARAPPATLAPQHPAPYGLLPPLRGPSLCRQPDKAPARGPFHHLSETQVFVTCRWAHSPTHPHTPTRTSPHP